MEGSMGLYELEREVENGRNAALAVEQ
jgi:hypothetical protein